ncbi:hypothetical protein [Streptosporangium sandarakinum]|uniref:hypothetical protein n=1 Tax=Streptosporangium sandarakinum TaxID=1260955 RepID=UPI0037238211
MAPPHAPAIAASDVFPWVRHLSVDELRAFTLEPVEALSGTVEAGGRGLRA